MMAKRISVDDRSKLEDQAARKEMKRKLNGKLAQDMRLVEVAELVLLLARFVGVVDAGVPVGGIGNNRIH